MQTPSAGSLFLLLALPGGGTKWLSRHWALSDKSQLASCQTGLVRREPGGESAWQQQELGAFCKVSSLVRMERLTAVSQIPK